MVAVGLFDTAANVLVAFATTRGSIGIVAVLSALYPVVDDRARTRSSSASGSTALRRLGGVLALAGAAVVAAG